MNLKVVVTFFLGMLCMTVVADVTNVSARQLVPWNLIEISYEMTDDRPGGMISLISGTTTYEAKTFVKQPTFEKGMHHVIWDAGADQRRVASDTAKFKVEVSEPVMPVVPGEYCVVDISKGDLVNEYSVSYTEARPAGGWTDEYKTSKIVLRKIEAGLSSGVSVPSCYIGVFELTQKQYELIMGENPITPKNVKGDTIPCTVNYYDVSKICTKLSAKTGLTFASPTSLVWKYACRAGVSTAYYNGGESHVDMRVIGRFSENGSAPCPVGSYLPNAWGLYDMLGNIDEWYDQSSPYKQYAYGGRWDSSAADCKSSESRYRSSAGVRLIVSVK